MISELANFDERLCASLAAGFPPARFEDLALELFALQYRHNPAYRRSCDARQLTPSAVKHWSHIPALPTVAFREWETTCLAPADRTAVFHSSGTTGQRPSRHFHCEESLRVYESSLWPWFARHLAPDFPSPISHLSLLALTPTPGQARHSSLVHMFETVRKQLGGTVTSDGRPVFVGGVRDDGTWTLDLDATLAALTRPAPATLLLGTAFSLLQLLDFLAERHLRLTLPAGSRVMETGGYKNRSRSLPKAELHALITDRLGVPSSHIVCEYGMAELGSQAYDTCLPSTASPPPPRVFRFPPWARAQVVSPETGREVDEEQTGMIRVHDLANVYSVLAVQTEDLGIRRGNGFELLGRDRRAGPRGCSLMTA